MSVVLINYLTDIIFLVMRHATLTIPRTPQERPGGRAMQGLVMAPSGGDEWKRDEAEL